jgi:outer membrane immunogenic protein
MNKLLIGSVALAIASLGSPALAADMPLKAPPPPVVLYNWTGCYVGLNIGTESGRSRWIINPPSVPASADFTNNFNLTGFIGGAQGGCNYQVANWVWGVEVDMDVANKSGQRFDLFNPVFWAKTEESWLGTARARLGYTVTDKWLWYVTGGGAWARFQYSEWSSANPILSGFQQTKWVPGWTVGGGTEYAVGYGWSIKSEFLYVKFRDQDIFPLGTVLPPGISCCKTVKAYDYVWRVGMNYKFGWTPAVVAKY